MKYVVVKAKNGLEAVVVFSPVLSRNEVVDAFTLAPKTMHLKPVSAGYVKCQGGSRCMGHSQSLGLKPRSDRDTLVLRIALSVGARMADENDVS